MAEQKDLFTRLKKMFSTDVIVRAVGGKNLKIIDTDEIQYATDRNSLRDRFNRLRSSTYNLHNRDMSMAYQASRLELFRDYDCVGEDTIIPLPDGTYPTIKELTEKYKDRPQERFHVFSYDHETDTIKLGNAYHPRKKNGGTRKCWKVIFDDKKFIIGSAGHPFLMRDGEYKKLEELVVGESVMPFYQKDFYGEGYRSIYNFSKGWQSEHKIVAEQFQRDLLNNEVVHHRDFNKTNNLPDNLVIMEDSEHRSYHAKLNNEKIWGPQNREKQLRAVIEGNKKRKPHKWNGKRKGEKNPFYGKKHTDISNEKRSASLIETFTSRYQNNEVNPNYREDLTLGLFKQKASDYYKTNGKLTSWGLVKEIGCDYSVLQNRLKSSGYDWNNFKHEVVSMLNHKITSIEYVGEMEVYDVTVEKYQNFATDSVFVHNTMDMDPIIASALDIYSDECLVPSEFGQVLTIRSKNENIKKILNNLFYDILNVEFNMWSWTRNMAKYGDFFLRMEISPEYGVYMVHPISPYELTRVEGSDPKNLNYVKYQHDGAGGGMEYENFEIAHFRLLSDSNFLPYGKSMIEPARRVWKQLSLMEDAMLIHRIMRAPEKRIFSIDVGNIAPSEIDPAMQKIISQVKKVPYIDEKTGDYNLRFNLNNMVEDFYLPVRGSDSGTKIDTLPGMEFTGIDDLEYVRNKMMAALKIPKAFLGYDESISGKATLAAEDVRFARTIGRIQRIIVSELTKIAIVHLYVQGYQDASLVDFELELSNPSTIFEQEKLEIWQNKVNLASDMMEASMFSKKWIYNKIFNMSGDDIESIQGDVIKDKKEAWRMEQITSEGNDPATSKQKAGEGGLADIGGEAGGDAGGEAGGDAGAEVPGLPPLEEIKEPEGQELDEETRREREQGIRDQTGNKEKYTHGFDKTRGEDPLGNGQNKEKSRTERSTRHIYRGSALSMDEDLKHIKQSLMTKYNNKQKKVITEEKSILDESNLINEDKPL